MRPHQPTPTPHMKGDNRRQRETGPLQSPRRRPHQPTPTPHIKGDNRRQWETTGDKTTSEPKKPTTPTNTKAARSKVALRTPTVNCSGKKLSQLFDWSWKASRCEASSSGLDSDAVDVPWIPRGSLCSLCSLVVRLRQFTAWNNGHHAMATFVQSSRQSSWILQSQFEISFAPALPHSEEAQAFHGVRHFNAFGTFSYIFVCPKRNELHVHVYLNLDVQKLFLPIWMTNPKLQSSWKAAQACSPNPTKSTQDYTSGCFQCPSPQNQWITPNANVEPSNPWLFSVGFERSKISLI